MAPVAVKDGYYQSPQAAGYGVQMHAVSMDRFEYPGREGGWWRSAEAKKIIDGERI